MPDEPQFDPKAYLKKKTTFDPKAYLATKSALSDATRQTLSPNVQEPQSRPLDSIIAPLQRLATAATSPMGSQDPMQTVSDIGSVGEFGLPLLAAPLPPFLRTVASGALQGTGTALKLAGQGAPPDRMLKGAGMSALTGMVGQGLGEVPISLLNKGAAPFASMFDKPTAELATKYGVDLPASALSKSGFVKATEALAAKGPFGAPLVQRVENAGQRLNQIADDMVTKFGTSTHPAEVGQTISNGLDKYESTFRATKDQLYRAADASKSEIAGKPEAALGELDNVINDLNNVVGKKPAILGYLKSLKSGLSPTVGKFDGMSDGLLSKLRAQGFTDETINKALPQMKTIYPNEFAPPVSEDIPVQKLTATLRDINSKINFKSPNPIAQGYEGRLRGIASNLSDDVDNLIKTSDPELGAAVDKANAYYKEGIGNLNSKWGQKITQFAQQGKLSELPSALLNKSTPAEWIPKIFGTVGEDATNSMKAATLEKIVTDAKGAGNGFFTPQGLAKQIRGYGDDKLSAIFGQEGTQKLKDLSQLSTAFGRGKQVAEGSQTGYVIQVLSLLKGITTAPLKAAKFIIGDKLFTNFITSETGQKFLTEGLSKIPSGVQAGVGNAARIGSQTLVNQQ